VIVLPAVVIPALSVIGVGPVPPVKVTEALPEPVIGPFIVTVPVVVGDRIVSGSLTASALTVTSPVPAALPIVILLKPSLRLLADEELTVRFPAAVTGFNVNAPVLVRELLILTVSAVSVMAPEAVEVAPEMSSAPVVLVRLMAPPPVAVVVKLAPSLSVMNTPPVPLLAVMVAACVRIFAPAVPMFLPLTAGVERFIVPPPTLRRVVAA
jgi:hypothetical protein